MARKEKFEISGNPNSTDATLIVPGMGDCRGLEEALAAETLKVGARAIKVKEGGDARKADFTDELINFCQEHRIAILAGAGISLGGAALLLLHHRLRQRQLHNEGSNDPQLKGLVTIVSPIGIDTLSGRLRALHRLHEVLETVSPANSARLARLVPSLRPMLEAKRILQSVPPPTGEPDPDTSVLAVVTANNGLMGDPIVDHPGSTRSLSARFAKLKVLKVNGQGFISRTGLNVALGHRINPREARRILSHFGELVETIHRAHG